MERGNIGPGIGAKLKYWDSGTSAYTEITDVNSLDWDGPSRNVIEVGGLNPTDEYVRKLQGLLNAGNITANIRYKYEQYSTLLTQAETRGNYYYMVELPDGAALEWEGFVAELPLSLAEDSEINGDCSFAIDGKADFLSGTAGSTAS